MNVIKNRSVHPQLREDEVLVLENAVRLAVDSILNVLCGLTGARTREHQRTVADRDKEIRRLEAQLAKTEHELQLLRGHGSTCRTQPRGTEVRGVHLQETDPRGTETRGVRTCADRRDGGLSGFITDGQTECEMSLSYGVFARPSSHISSFSQDSVPPSSPSGLGSDQTWTSRSSESGGVTETCVNPPASPSSLVVKDEPCDIDAVFIKWEMSEETLVDQETPEMSSVCPPQDGRSPHVNENLELRSTEDSPADLGGPGPLEEEALGNRKKSVRMSELPEEAQRLKRAAWRAASRRYYARKIARQKANPSRFGTFLHVASSRGSEPSCLIDSSPAVSQPGCVPDRRRRVVMSETLMSQDPRTLQREAWRAASRRYYARKVARHQTEHEQYRQLMESLNASGASQGPNGEGVHADGGSIMCS